MRLSMHLDTDLYNLFCYFNLETNNDSIYLCSTHINTRTQLYPMLFEYNHFLRCRVSQFTQYTTHLSVVLL